MLGALASIGERVRVLVAAGTVRITRAGVEAACRPRSAGRGGRVTERAHFEGGAGAAGRGVGAAATALEGEAAPIPAPAWLAPAGRARGGGRWGLVMGAQTPDELARMLTRPRPTAVRITRAGAEAAQRSRGGAGNPGGALPCWEVIRQPRRLLPAPAEERAPRDEEGTGADAHVREPDGADRGAAVVA